MLAQVNVKEVRTVSKQATASRAEPAVPDDAPEEIVTAVLTASRALVGVSARSLGGVEETVTLTQFRTLVVLHAHGPARLNQLADRLQVNSSTALRTVDRMIAGGLVDRRENQADRRQVVIELTARGRRVVDDVTERRRQAIEQIVKRMSLAHRKQMVEALQAFAAAADEPLALGDAATLLGW
jgi:DNA-binding MarR family transcriptional regulator